MVKLSACILFLCLLCSCPGLAVQAKDQSDDGRVIENQSDNHRETEIYLAPAGQTAVSAWVEVSDKPEDQEPEENDQSEDDPAEETPDQMQPGGEEIKTADQNAVVAFIVVFLVSGIVIIAEGRRVVKEGKQSNNR